MFSNLDEFAESENIAASLALTQCISDTHPRALEAEKQLDSRSPGYKSVVFSFAASLEHSGRKIKINDWYCRSVARTLLSDDWRLLSRDGIRSAITIMKMAGNKGMQILLKLGVAPILVPIIEALLVDKPDRTKRPHNIDCGLIKAFYQPQDPVLNCGTWDAVLWREFSKAGGFFEVAHAIFRLAATRQESDLSVLAETIGANREILTALPQSLRRQLPRQLLKILLDEASVARVGEDEIAKMFSEDRLGEIVHYEITDNENETASVKMIEKIPEIAFSIFNGPRFWRKQKFLLFEDQSWATKLGEKLVSDPMLLMAHPETWGKLISMAPSLAPRLRRAIIEVAGDEAVSLDFVHQVFPFPLDLPSEASLLPHIANTIAESAYPRRVVFDDDASPTSPDDLDALVKRFFPSVRALFDVSLDRAHTGKVAGAAAIFLFMHPETDGAMRRSAGGTIIACYEEVRAGWYLKSAAVALRQSIVGQDLDARGVMARLLDLAKGDFEARRALEVVIESWRQASSAPVRSTAASPVWR